MVFLIRLMMKQVEMHTWVEKWQVNDFLKNNIFFVEVGRKVVNKKINL